MNKVITLNESQLYWIKEGLELLNKAQDSIFTRDKVTFVEEARHLLNETLSPLWRKSNEY